MKTPMLKRRLNPFLLVSTVLILSLLAGLSVLYQGQLSELVSERQSLQQEISQKTDRIQNLEEDKSNLTSRLRATEKERNKYINLYESEKKKRENLEENRIPELESRIEKLESTTEKIRENIQDLNTSLAILCTEDGNNITSTSEKECRKRGHDPDES